MKRDGFGHEDPFEGKSNDWITPKWVVDAFDTYAQEKLDFGCLFDLDPCASVTQPWNCARKAYTKEQDGFIQQWFGTVYLNPEYGHHTFEWVKKLIEHGDGIALIFARVETRLWQKHIFPTADGFLLPNKRISFSRPDGTTPKSSSGAPSAFIAWGSKCRDALIEVCDKGLISGAFLDRAFYTGSKRNG